MKTFSITPFLITLALLFSIGMGCSSTPVDENDPADLMKEAEGEISTDHYQIAIDKLRALKNKFPYSKYAIDAQLRIADVYFLQESFAEAAGSYEAFSDLHPKHEKASYAMYRTARSYFSDAPTNIARDLTSAHRALDAYQLFLRRFPTAPEVKDARKDINDLRQLLANREFYIGDFYFIRNFYDSAKPRFEKIIELYPETEAAQKSQALLKKIPAKPKE